MRRDFGHEPVAIPGDTLERYTQHLVHTGIGFGGLEKTNAAIVGIAHQLRELLLAQVTLHLAGKTSSAKRKPGHLHV